MSTKLEKRRDARRSAKKATLARFNAILTVRRSIHETSILHIGLILTAALALFPIAASANSDLVERALDQAALRVPAVQSGSSFQDGFSKNDLYGTPVPVPSAYEAGGSKSKNPTTALVLSLLIPSVGQFYNGHVLKGVGFLALQFVGATMYAVGRTDEVLTDVGQVIAALESEEVSPVKNEKSGLKWGGLGIMAANSLLSRLEAYHAANNINGRANYRGVALYRNIHTGRSLGLSLDPMLTASGNPRGQFVLQTAF